MLAVLEAQTAQFEARMAAASQTFNRFNSATASSRRGIAMLRGGLEQLAFRAAGASGPVGRLAGGLLTLGGGGGAALIAAGAIGTVALAIRLLTADAREGKRAQDALIQSLMKLGAHGQMGGIRQQIAQLEGLRDAPNLGAKLIGLGKGFLGDITGDLLGAGRPRQIEIINRRIAELRGQLGAAGEDFGAPGRAVRAGADQSVAAARLRRDMSGLVGGSRATDTALAEALRAQTLALNPETRAIARTTAARERLAAEIEVSITALSGARQLGEEAALRRRMIGAPALAITEALAVRDAIQRGVPPAAAQDAARQSRAAAASMQTTELLRTMGPQIAMQSLLAAQQGGGAGFAGAFFPGAAGLAAALPGVGPFAGAGIQLVGGLLGNLFSGIETSAERRHREHMEKLEKLAQEVGLERVTVVFTGPDGHQVRKTLAELESSDAVERVPVAVGASG